jgi:hypothetical protein
MKRLIKEVKRRSKVIEMFHEADGPSKVLSLVASNMNG